VDTGGAASLAESVSFSIDYIGKLPPEKALHFGRDEYTASEMSASLAQFHKFLLTSPDYKAIKEFVTAHFNVYAAPGSGPDGAAFFTGYYTPDVAASASPDETFKYPLYGMPADLVTADLGLFREIYKGEKVTGRVEGGTLVPYYTRADIDGAGALSGRGLELAWCRDPVELFFMQVQGSAVLSYPDGTTRHANYKGANGRQYRSIGKLLIDEGKADKDTMSMDLLKSYLRAHPDEAGSILNYNESYVFFELSDSGPYGSLGEPVTPMRTIATDSSLYPPGALVFIDTEIPDFYPGPTPIGWGRWTAFALNQDTGGAIKGPGRADIYFGYGDFGRLKAGHMKRAGRLYFLAGKRN